MTDLRKGIDDLRFFSKHMKGMIEMIPFLEECNQIESDLKQNKASLQKATVLHEEMKEKLCEVECDVQAAMDQAAIIGADAEDDHQKAIALGKAEAGKIVAAANKKVNDLQHKADSQLKDTTHHISEQEKKLARVSKDVANEQKDLKAVQDKIAKIKEGL